MLAERRSLPRRDPSHRVSAAPDVGSPAHLAHSRQGSIGSAYNHQHHHHHHPVHRSVAELSRLGISQPRANSDPNLATPEVPSRSSLSVSKQEYTLGLSEPLQVFWDVREPVSASDWIGLYNEGETSPFNYLEYKTQGENRSHVGQISWHIGCDLLFTQDVTNVCFKYYSGTTGVLRSVSPSFRVIRGSPSQNCNANSSNKDSSDGPALSLDTTDGPTECIVFRLSNVHARNLKKGIFFNPDPYAKMCIRPGKQQGTLLLPHHNQEARTVVADNTVCPNWNGLFTFVAYTSDVLEFEVKDKFSKSRPSINRFLGRLSLPLWMLLEKAKSQQTECHFSLTSKHPSDHVTGQLVFTVSIEKRPGEPWPLCLPANVVTLRESLCSTPGTPDTASLRHGSVDRTSSLPNGNAIGAGAEGSIDSDSSSMANGNAGTSNNNNSTPVLRHRQLQQSDFEPARKPKLADRTNPTHGTWHGRTAARSKGQSDSPSGACAMTSSMHEGDVEPPPPLPPKLKKNQPSHRPLHRTKALPIGIASTSSENTQQQVHYRAPEDSFNFEIVDTDELECSGESTIELQGLSDSSSVAEVEVARSSPWLFIDANANISLVPDLAAIPPEVNGSEENGVATGDQDVVVSENRRMSGLYSYVAPLATPEQDSLQDGILSVENLSESTESRVEECETVKAATQQTFMPNSETETVCPVIEVTEVESETEVQVDVVEEGHIGSGTPNETRLETEETITDTDDANTSVGNVAADGDSETTTPMLTPQSPEADVAMTSSVEHSAASVFSDSSDDQNEVRSPVMVEAVDTSTSESESCSSSHDVVAACSSSSVLPQCPPTPTHHPCPNRSQGGRPLTPTPGPSCASDTPPVWQPRPPPPVPPPLPARHLQPPALPQHQTATRLPSIPERTVKFQQVELSPGEEPLPAYWEARIDSHGRVFYIDHLNRTTTWQRPSASQLRRNTNNELQRLQLDRRYQSIRRTISSRPSLEAEDQPPPLLGAEGGQPSGSSREHHREVLLRTPAVRFVTRPDFFSVLHMTGEAVTMYNRNSSLKHMVTKIRRDAHAFERYQHNRDLVTLLNKFADSSRDLPRGWETKYDRTGKQFFIDHTSRSTTFIDPRLPVDAPCINPNRPVLLGARRRSRSAGEDDIRPDGTRGPIPPPRPAHNTTATVAHVVPHVPTAYSDKVVAFLRQPNIVDILRERHPAVGSNQILKDKINAIRVDGPPALDRLSDDIDLIILLSLFEQEIMSYVPAQYCHRSPRDSPQQSPQASPALLRANARAPAPYKRDFEAKLRNFYRKLESKGYGQGPGKLKINIRRDHLLEDAFNKIMMASKKDLQKSKLYVTFAGEEGLDYGGPSREFFFLLSRELFNPYYGLFEYSANDTYTVQVSPMSAFVDNLHEWFRFSGRVLGLALVHQYLLDAFFTRPFYKALLRILCSLSDLESLDAEFHQSLLWIKENDITDILDLNFSVNEEVFGQVVERELKPGGKTIPVTEKNKKEYIEKVVKWRLERGVAEQTESLVKGFYEVVDTRLVSVFDARELELVIAGIAEVDVNDWRKNTEYRSGYCDNHPVMQWFWLAIEKIDNERRLRLLQFVTGTSSIPYEGFAALRGSNGPRKFCIEKWGKPSSLPRAHTCFNRLDLPPYPSFEMLYEKLLLAVEETSTFGIE